jgi:hypothetical protein
VSFRPVTAVWSIAVRYVDTSNRVLVCMVYLLSEKSVKGYAVAPVPSHWLTNPQVSIGFAPPTKVPDMQHHELILKDGRG